MKIPYLLEDKILILKIYLPNSSEKIIASSLDLILVVKSEISIPIFIEILISSFIYKSYLTRMKLELIEI